MIQQLRALPKPLALLLTLLGGSAAGRLGAQQTHYGGEGFQLSRSPDFTSTDLGFSTMDSLHMRLWCSRFAAPGETRGVLRGSWRLDRPEGGFEGALEPTADGAFGATFDLAQLPRITASWTWTARMEDAEGVLYSPSLELTITLPPPVAAFRTTILSGDAPLAVAFEDLSSGSVSSWSWDFGDGATSGEREPSHVYAAGGSYSVTLTVSNSSGSSSESKPGLIQVAEPVTEFALLYGMNASENVWSQRGIAFADAMARASEFCIVADGALTSERAPCLPPGEYSVLGAGWPDLSALDAGEQAGARLFGNMAGSTPDGRVEPYVLTWEGTGSCRLAGNGVLSERERSSNRVEVFVDPGAGNGDALLSWVVDSSSPTDPVRDAHVWLPGMEKEKPVLWPPFVEKLQAMNGGRGPSTWRAMDWNQVRQYGRNGGAAPFVFDLAGRITPASPSQGTRRGVCPEFIVALCNAVGADLHFCVPHAANGIPDEDYESFVRDALTVLRDGSPAIPGVNGGQPFAGLRPDLRLTLEYSNEIWNPGFPVNIWMKNRATAAGITLHRQIALEITRVFAIADEVFAGSESARLRKYVGGWTADDMFLQRILDALDPSVRVDALGPAGYFKPLTQDVDHWLTDAGAGDCPNCPTPERVIESARSSIEILRTKLREHRLLADAHQNADGSRPALVLYEAGQSFLAGYQPWASAAVQAQSHPNMFDAYARDLVPMLVEEGVDEVLWYSFISDNSAQGNGAGPFGLWDNMNQTVTLPVSDPYLHEGAPKAAAIYMLPPTR